VYCFWIGKLVKSGQWLRLGIIPDMPRRAMFYLDMGTKL